MKALVDRLRSVTGAAADDEFGGVVYWDDDQLQAELDLHRADMYDETLTSVSATEYLFKLPRGAWVEDDFTVRDSDGNEVDATVTIRNDHGVVTTEEDAATIDYAVYDWNGAAASVWEQKAAHRYDYITLKTGDHRFDAQQEYEHCVARAQFHRGRRVKSFSRPVRGFVPASYQRPRRR